MDEKVKEQVLKAIDEENAQGAETILVIKRKPKLALDENEEVTLNEGYEYEVNSGIPELADAIAKLALELPKNGQGETSDYGFIVLIEQFFDKLRQEQKENK